MSELSDLTAGSVSGLIPGYALSRLNNTAIGEVEAHLQRWYVEGAVRATADLAPDIRSVVVAKAVSDASYFLCYDTPTFRRKLRTPEGREITVLSSIGIRVPNVDEADVRRKLNALDADVIERVVDWCWGRELRPDEKKAEFSDGAETPGP